MQKKQLSGAAKRKLRKQRLAAELALSQGDGVEPGVEPDPLLAGDSSSSAVDRDDGSAFELVGPPPLDDLNEALLWSRKLLMVVTYQVARSRYAKLSEKRYAISDMVAKLGMTHAKSLVDKDLKTVRKRLEGSASRRTKAYEVSTASLAKPATARGARGDRGGASLSEPVPGATSPEDAGDDPVGGG